MRDVTYGGHNLVRVYDGEKIRYHWRWRWFRVPWIVWVTFR
jgi:hypothetical protein